MTLHRIRLLPYDYLVISYCLLMTLLILVFGRPMTDYADELLFYPSMAAVAALIVRFVGESESGWRRFLRLLYPALMFTFFYRATGGTMYLFFDRFFDYQIVAIEGSILGVEPSLLLDRNWLHPYWNELFSASYFSFYLMIPTLLLVLYLTRRDELIRCFLTACCAAFFASYLMFFLYPIEGPRYYLAGQYLNGIDGPFFRQLVNIAIEKGAVHGGCMPSSHVAVALVVLAYASKASRKVGWILVPVNVGLAIGTVWGRFHYVSDVLAGAAIGLGSVWVVERFYSVWTSDKEKAVIQRKLSTEHVS